MTSTSRLGFSNGVCGNGSIGGSEYSFPPSYRSRNTNTPGTINSERSIETEPSGRLLANEDLPEPLSVEQQLSEYGSLRNGSSSLLRSINSRISNELSSNEQKSNSGKNVIQSTLCKLGMEKPLKSLRTLKNHPEEAADSGTNEVILGVRGEESLTTAQQQDNLVTIVTIPSESTIINPCSEANPATVTDQIEILAHL